MLQAEAAKRQCSKASLIRACVSARFGGGQPGVVDPLTAWIGRIDIGPAAVDDVVYGR